MTAPRPVVVVLTTHWEAATEGGWAARQVAGALACAADVHVVTPQGRVPGASRDSVFTVHELGQPVDPRAELRRDLLLDALSAGAGAGPGATVDLGPLLDEDLVHPWHGAAAVIQCLHPDLAVVVDHRNLGGLAALDGVPALPCSLLVLGPELAGIASAHLAPVFDRAGTVLAVTRTEADAVVRHHPRARVHRIGLPGAANPTALREPNTWVGDTGYVLVLTNAPGEPFEPAEEGETETLRDKLAREARPEATLARLLRFAFPDVPVGISSTRDFSVWHRGRLSTGWPIERSSDLARLVAWAAVTVDLRPGPLVARRCIDSLLYGTPIVVPSDSRAREHAELGRGGLWFANPGELVWCVDAMLDPDVGPVLGSQGKQYAEEHYGSTTGFVTRVLAAVGLEDASARPPLPEQSGDHAVEDVRL